MTNAFALKASQLAAGRSLGSRTDVIGQAKKQRPKTAPSTVPLSQEPFAGEAQEAVRQRLTFVKSADVPAGVLLPPLAIAVG